MNNEKFYLHAVYVYLSYQKEVISSFIFKFVFIYYRRIKTLKLIHYKNLLYA
jgi:hypothetical protein